MQPPVNCAPLQPDSESYYEPGLGEQVAFTLSEPIPGSDAPPMTFPIYRFPSGLALLPGQSSVQTILASAVSSRPDVWSTGVPGILGILGIAHWLLRVCQAVRIELRPMQARRSQILIQHILSTARHIQSGTAIPFKNVPQKQGSEKPVSYSVERPPFLA